MSNITLSEAGEAIEGRTMPDVLLIRLRWFLITTLKKPTGILPAAAQKTPDPMLL